MAGVFVSMMQRTYVVQIGGPKEDDVWSGPNRKISFGIFEICWGQAVSRSTFAASSTGYFDRDVETDLVDMERARMKVTRVCIYHVDHDASWKITRHYWRDFCTHAF